MSAVQETRTPNGFRVTSIIIAVAMVGFIAPVFLTGTTQNVNATDYEARSGYLDPGNAIEWYLVNDLINVTFDAGYWFVKSVDDLAKFGNSAYYMQTNGSHGVNTLAYPSYSRKVFFRDFTDALGTGVEAQLMFWGAAGKLNSSFYWRMYDNKQYVTTWMEVKNSLGYYVNMTVVVNQVYYTYVASGVRVGSVAANIWKWRPAAASGIWVGSGAGVDADGRDSRTAPVAMITASGIQKSITIGQLEEKKGGGFIRATSDVHDSDALGLSAFYLGVDSATPDSGSLPYEKIENGANWTGDKAFIGFTNSNRADLSIVDWGAAVLAFNTLKTESMPFTGKIWCSWDSYPHNVTQNATIAIIDFISTYHPEINWITIDDGWQYGSSPNTYANQKDTLAMEVEPSRWTDMAATISYAHSKGIKVCLWIDTNRMWFDGQINASHPDYRLLKTDGSPYIWTIGSGPTGGGGYYGDITNPNYRAYVATQLQAMKTSWDVDGFKLDFQVGPPLSKRWYNYNYSAVHSEYVWESAIFNVTSTTELVIFGTPLSWNPLMAGIAHNVFYTSIETTSTYSTWKDGINNYTMRYLPMKWAFGDLAPLFTVDQISMINWGIPMSSSFLQNMVTFNLATGSTNEFSFYPASNSTYFDAISPLLLNGNKNSTLLIGGQDGTTHKNDPSLFGSSDADYDTDMSPTLLLGVVNFVNAPTSVSGTLSYFGLTGPVEGFSVYDESYDTLNASFSVALPAQSSRLYAIGSGSSSQVIYSNADVLTHSVSQLIYESDWSKTVIALWNSSVFADSDGYANWSFSSNGIRYGYLITTNAVGSIQANNLAMNVNIDSGSIEVTNFRVEGSTIIWNGAVTTSDAIVTFTLSGLESGRMYRLYVDGVKDLLLTASGSGVISFTYSGPWSEHQFEIVATSVTGQVSGLVNLIFIMFAVGIVVGVIAGGTHSLRRKEMLTTEQMMKSLLNMVIYIIIGLAGIGILYSIVV